MENMQKVVTAQDIANIVGCTLSSVNMVMGSNCKSQISEELKSRIRSAAAEMGYDPVKAKFYGSKRALETRWKGRVTLSDVAKDCGMSVSSVHKVLHNPDLVSKATMAAVTASMKKLGFVPYQKLSPEERKEKEKAKRKAERERNFSFRYAGFKNREEQNAYMEAMRSMGHSNAQISRKIGLTIQTVRRRIGPQPDDMSHDNRVAGMKHHAAENQRRRVYVDTHLVRTYNEMVVECAQLRSHAAELVSKADHLAVEIKKLEPQVANAKLSTVEAAKLPEMQPQTQPTTPAVSPVLQ